MDMLQDSKGRDITIREGAERVVMSALLHNAPWWVKSVTLSNGEQAGITSLLEEFMAGGEIEIDAGDIGWMAVTQEAVGRAMVEWVLEYRENVIKELEGDSVVLDFDGVTPDAVNEILQLALFADIIYGEEEI